MFPDGAVDWDSLSALVEWHIAEGTDGIVAVGTTGESATLNVDEHTEVIRRVVKLSKKRVPIIAGPGANRSEEHTSELQSLMRISYAVFCLNKKHQTPTLKKTHTSY